MKYLVPMLMSLTLLFSSFSSHSAQGKVTGGIAHEIPDWFKESFLEFAEDSLEADEENKHVMLFLHLNDCPYCSKMLHENFADNQLKPFITQHFDSIAINIKGDREIVFNEEITTTERVLANYLKVKYTPTIIFLNKSNQSVLRLNGYRSPEVVKQALNYVNDKAYLKTTFNQFKKHNMQYGKYKFIASPLLSEITDLSELSTPVAILFEDKNCDDCAAFHNTMLTRKTINEQLNRYTVVRFDADSKKTIIDFEGNKTTPAKWVEKLNLSYRPGIVFFDEKKETARVESFLYPFHLESVIRFGLNKSYKLYNSYLDLMAVRQQKLLEQGVDVNIGAIN